MYLNTGALLEQAGHSVHYFAASSANDLPCQDASFFPDGTDTKNAGVKDVVRYLYNKDARNAMEALLTKYDQIDIAHLHIYYGRLTPAILKPLIHRSIPIVQSLHEYKLACPVYTMERRGATCDACISGSTVNCVLKRCKDNSLIKSSMQLLEYHTSRLLGDVRLINKFICVSDFQRELLTRAGLPKEKMVTLHNFVDSSALQPEVSEPRGSYLLYYGRIETLKGLSTLIDAVKLTDVPLKIAGTGSWTHELLRRIADVPQVEYLGFVSGDPLRRLVAQARAVVVPSEWYETFGLTALEAKAVGTPVIAANIGGLREVVQPGKDGFLHTPGNVNSLAEAIDNLSNCNLKEFGLAGKADVENRFSPAVYLDRLTKIYSEAASHY